MRRFNHVLKRSLAGVSQEAMEILLKYSWPGNVRQLENCVERAFIVSRGPYILPKDLPHEISDAIERQPALPEDEDEAATHERIVTVLNQTDWNVAKSARLLGIARNTLYQKMKSLNIVRPPD